MKKNLGFSKTEIRNLKPNDFIFLLFNPEDMVAEDIERLAIQVEKFEKKLPENVGIAFIPSIDAIVNSSDRDVIKLFIDDIIDEYNKHFNEIYLPYTE